MCHRIPCRSSNYRNRNSSKRVPSTERVKASRGTLPDISSAAVSPAVLHCYSDATTLDISSGSDKTVFVGVNPPKRHQHTPSILQRFLQRYSAVSTVFGHPRRLFLSCGVNQCPWQPSTIDVVQVTLDFHVTRECVLRGNWPSCVRIRCRESRWCVIPHMFLLTPRIVPSEASAHFNMTLATH